MHNEKNLGRDGSSGMFVIKTSAASFFFLNELLINRTDQRWIMDFNWKIVEP